MAAKLLMGTLCTLLWSKETTNKDELIKLFLLAKAFLLKFLL